MPESTRLLYILSDLAYVTKLVQGKKPHDFVLSDFRQINGEFVDENTLLSANLEKLFSKLEAGSYKLILPDFLFTSTIVTIELADEAAVKKHLQEKLLPDLGINDTDYYLDTTVLSNYKGAFKVQLTALEKSVVAPLAAILTKHDQIQIESMSPLSWSAKSLISLEPSVAILQMGENLFLAEHYIGVDQCYSVPVVEAANFAETVKTLKGAEPSLQTVYLLTNSLVDDAIKDKLKETLPVQQLADLASEQEAMPSYVKQVIEASAKTFSIPEFLLPQFVLDKNYQSVENESEQVVANLVKPAVIGMGGDDEIVASTPKSTVAVAVESLDEDSEAFESELESKPKAKVESEQVDTTIDTKMDEQADEEEGVAGADKSVKVTVKKEAEIETEVSVEMPSDLPTASVPATEVDFSQFANLALDPSVFGQTKPSSTEQSESRSDGKAIMQQASQPAAKQVIKNQDDGSSVAKMIFIGFLSFVVTIALGVGLGLAYLQWTNHQDAAKPIVEVEATPTPSPIVTATPAPLPEIVKADYKLLVVNATTKAGYAGTIATKIKEADFTQVQAKNAKGIYEPGDFLLVKEDTATAQALLKELNQATQLEMTLVVGMDKEDTTGAYSGVIVLNK